MSDELKPTQEELEIEQAQEQEQIKEINEIPLEGNKGEEVVEPVVQEEPKDEQQEEEKDDKADSGEPEIEVPVGHEDEPAQENKEFKEEKGEVTAQEPATEEVDVEALRKEVEELRAVQKEEAALKEFEVKRNTAIRQYDETCEKLANALAGEFERYGIDTTKTLEDIKKEDPAKAQIAIGLITQAERLKSEHKAKINSELNSAFTDMVFDKAARLMDKFGLTEDQQVAAAETFLTIMENTGIKDMAEDLATKVELAVAKAKMVAPAVEKAVKETVEAVQAVQEAAEVIKEEVPPVEKNEPAKEEPVKPEPVVEAVDVSDFEDGIAGGKGVPEGNAITVDNVLEKLAALPHKERVGFYKEHFALINQASAKQSARVFEKRKNM